MHEQNGLSERKIRHIVDTSLTLPAHAKMPLKYWNFAMEQSTISINILPSNVLKQKSPCQLLYHKNPKFLDFKPLRCSIFPLLRPYNAHKYHFRSTLCVYLSQSSTHSAYRCVDKHTGRIYLARHVRFITT
jgi:hypothetical protein